MFNRDFYPTPHSLLDTLGIDCAGKIVLEPSAGKGNIIDWLKANGAAEVLACENHPELATIARSKAKRFIGEDFLKVTSEQISHIDMIVMNPPFSADEKHIIHAFKIAPGGCTIHAFCNWSTLDNHRYGYRRELNSLIENYGIGQNLGQVFATAERGTNVSIGYITLHKPGAKPGMDEFEGFFMDDVPEELPNGPGIMRFNAIRDIVQRYVHSCRKFDEFDAIAEQMNRLTGTFGIGSFKFALRKSDGGRGTAEYLTKDQFRIELQKAAWASLFNQMNMDKYITSGVKEKINAFAEQQQKVPFTERNVYRMFEIIVATSESNFNEALVNAVDHFTKHHHENRFGVEGWKTNSVHMLNQKFIIERMFQMSWSNGAVEVQYASSTTNAMIDLTKVLCSLTATPFETIPDIENYVRYKVYTKDQSGKYLQYWRDHDDAHWFMQKPENKDLITLSRPQITWGEWFEWGFFEIRAYKKGTCHARFKNIDHWALLNQRYAKLKGVTLPEKTWQRPSRKKSS